MSEDNARSRVVLAHPGPLIPAQGGGDVRTLNLLEYLHANGFEVHLITGKHGAAETKQLEQRAYKVWSVNPHVGPQEAYPALRDLVRKIRRYRNRKRPPGPGSDLHRRRNHRFEDWCFEIAYEVEPAAVITPFAWHARILDRIPPDALGILDTIDVQHVRTERAREAGGDLDTRKWSRVHEQRELERADVLVAMQREEAALLEQMCPESHVLVVGHACPVSAAPLQPSEEKTVVFAANLYDPNRRGIENFLRDVWPALRARVPGANLIVCGRICEALSNPPPGVQFKGYVPDLESIYMRAAVLINPVPYSTGLSVKVSEALARGRCVVATNAGVRGLDEHLDLPVDVADSPDEMVAALARLLQDPEERTRREGEVWAWARQHLAPEAVYKPIAEAIRDRKRLIRP